MKPELTIVMRAPKEGVYSIERLFASLEPYFEKRFDCRRLVVPEKRAGLLSILKNARYARKHATGVKHVTGDTQYLAAFLGTRVVLTIHDCGYLMGLKGVRKIFYKWLWFKLPCWRAARIAVISESTRQVLQREVGSFGSKVVVIENCVTLSVKPSVRPFNKKVPRILQIGTGYHKNLDGLIRAVDGLDCELHIVGKLSRENLQDLASRKVRYKNEWAVSDDRLEAIFGECDMLFFASRHEGFGLPILEGQAAGIPVITSIFYSMPEVAGKGACLVNPESPTEIRSAIEAIRDQEELRQYLVNEGTKNLERYQANKVAEKYMELYACLHSSPSKAE